MLQQTQIEDFDEVEEAFKLLDVNGERYLTIDMFKAVFEKLELGKIDKADEDIFRDVTFADEQGRISLESFRKILSQQEDSQPALMGQMEHEMDDEYDDEM